MKGNNTLRLNQSTIQEAIEYWLKGKVMKDGNIRVVKVKWLSDRGMDYFDVEIAETTELFKGKEG